MSKSRNRRILVLTILTDNLTNPSEWAFGLTDHAVIILDGPDAVAFAQAQFSNDINALEDGHWQWSSWLTAKGRVIAVFALLRLASTRLMLVLPDTSGADMAAALKRFVFRKKVRIDAPSDLQVHGALRAPAQARDATLAINNDVIELDFGSPQFPRLLQICARPAKEDALALSHWRDIDLRHGLPRLDMSQREQWTPQQLSLDRLRAFSVKKGCYPGQEIVARTHFLGKAKRGLGLLESDVVLAPGSPIEENQQTLGQIVAASTNAPGPLLAVLPLDQALPNVLHSGANTLRRQPLLDGLAR